MPRGALPRAIMCWFCADPMGDVNVSPQEWVDEWLSEVASDEGTYTEGLSP